MSKINGIGTEIKMHFVVTVNVVFYFPTTSYIDTSAAVFRAEINIP